MPERDCLQVIQTQIRPFTEVEFREQPVHMDVQTETGCERLRGFHRSFKRAAVDCLDGDVFEPGSEPLCLLAPLIVEVYSGGSTGDDVSQMRGCPVPDEQKGSFHALYRRTIKAKMQITTGGLAAR
jgi:hypothetical protein